MKRIIPYLWVLSAAGLGSSTAILAQGLLKTQPKLLTIIREEVKTRRNAEHAKHETGWPAAFEKAKSTDYYIGITSMTGPNEAWFIIPSESHAAMAASMKQQDKDPVLSAELDRLSLADAEYISGARTIQAVAMPELTVGDFPDANKVRFLEITTCRIKPGHGMQFQEGAKAYTAARKRADEKAGYRVYEVIAGMPSPTYLIVASVEDYGQFDKRMAVDMETWKQPTDDEKATLQKSINEAIISMESNRFRVDPHMSFVPKETRDSDPEFWAAK